MKKFYMLFACLFSVSVSAQFNPALLQQGLGTVMSIKSRVSDIKGATGSCKFTASDKKYIFNLLEEYNKEAIADGDKDGDWEDDWKVAKETESIGSCDECIVKVGTAKWIYSADDITDRGVAKQVINALKSGKWSAVDFSASELKRINKIIDVTACACEAVNMLGGVKDGVLAPMLGNIMPGAEGMLGGAEGGLGGLQGILGNMGGAQ